jgi:hypothetical protein
VGGYVTPGLRAYCSFWMRLCEGVNLRCPRVRLLQSFQAFEQCAQCLIGIFELTFPYCKNAPSVAEQFLHYPAISIYIRFQFFCPEIDTCFRQNCVFAAGMTMPKTPVHKNADFQSRQYNVRFSWQVPAMKSEAVTMCMQKPSDSQFRFGVFSLDPGHHSGSRRAVNYIHFVLSQNSVVS